MPGFAAAPELPDTRPFASARAASIISRSWSRILLLREVLGPLRQAVARRTSFVHGKDTRLTEDDRPLDHVLEFADVAGPRVIAYEL